jgi:hypothetical protein
VVAVDEGFASILGIFNYMIFYNYIARGDDRVGMKDPIKDINIPKAGCLLI